MDPLGALRRIAFLLERRLEPTFKVKAYRTAAAVVVAQGDAIERRVEQGTLTDLRGIGPKTAQVITEALRGEVPSYLRDLETSSGGPLVNLDDAATALRRALRGDLHVHSDWSDGGSPIEEMAITAIELGHSYVALTDHSPRLTVARGLTAERLAAQLDVIAELAPRLEPFRLLSGIEVDINDDGTLDQTATMLARLDVVVASVHSKLSMDSAAMTRRMIAAVRDPSTNILGHCTGRLIGDAKKRPQSSFDAAAVFAECAERGVAVEINCRPERRDPPPDLLALAVEAGCLFSMDTDAHAPGQLDWHPYGCETASACSVPPERIVNTWPADRLLEWSRRNRSR
jgi:putative hydrolase